MNKEKILQAKIVIDFSQKRPEERGLLWATLNRTLSVRDGQAQLAQGLVKGVPDLIYFNETLVGFEVKAPGEKHKRSHIEAQLRWGEKIEHNGGFYFIITGLEGFWHILNSVDLFKGHPQVYNPFKIRQILDTQKSTIVF